MGLFKINRQPLVLNGITFNYVNEEDELMIKCAIADNEINSWNLNYENIIAYNTEKFQHIVYKIIDGFLCFFCFYPGVDRNKNNRIIDFAFRPLILDNSCEYVVVDVMEKIKEILKIANNSEKVYMVYMSESDKILFKDIVTPHKVKSFNEFVYDLEYLVKLDGSKFKNVRRDYNRFERDYPDVKLEKYDKEKHKSSCLSLVKIWETEYTKRYNTEPIWHNSMLYYLDNLSNTETSHAFVLLDKFDNVIGYMNSVFMYGDMCCCIKRITDTKYTNSSNYLLIRVVKELYTLGYMYMNDGNAGGDTDTKLGLFKMRYVNENEQYQYYLYNGTFK